MPQRENFVRSSIYVSVLVLGSAFLASSAVAQPQTCPPEGTATTQSEKDLNLLKNRDDAPPADQIDPNATLSAVLAPGADLDRWSTAKGATFEGIVLKVKSGAAETPNCGARDPIDQDTHIELALSPDAPAAQRVIVEVTPRWRQKMAVIEDWSTKTLHDRMLGHRVRVTGWLFADSIHKGQAENTHPGGKKNWRATVWEIHPITGITVLSSVVVGGSAPVSSSMAHRKTSKRRCSHAKGHVCHRTTHVKRPTGA